MLDPATAAAYAAPPAIERVYEDAKTGYRGFVVVDSLSDGHANGGIRIRPGLSLEEIRATARVMTWKYRFAGVPQGGAKAGVDGPEDLPREEKARRLAWLAENARDLIDGGLFGIGPDLGTDGALVGELLNARGLLRGRHAFPGRFRGSGYYTALSAVEAASAALDVRKEGWRGRRVAVEGFGAVGANAARLMAARGARVVAISTNGGTLHHGDGLDLDSVSRSADPLDGDPRAERLPAEALLRLDVDVLSPCGPGGTIDAALAETMAARVIAPGANCAVSPEAADVLHRKGCLVIPCFAANCGGVTAAAMRLGGVPERGIAHLLSGLYRQRMCALLQRALDQNRVPLSLFLETLPPLRGGDAESEGAALFTRARALVRSRLVPRPFLALPSYWYFRGRIAAGAV